MNGYAVNETDGIIKVCLGVYRNVYKDLSMSDYIDRRVGVDADFDGDLNMRISKNVGLEVYGTFLSD